MFLLFELVFVAVQHKLVIYSNITLAHLTKVINLSPRKYSLTLPATNKTEIPSPKKRHTEFLKACLCDCT